MRNLHRSTAISGCVLYTPLKVLWLWFVIQDSLCVVFTSSFHWLKGVKRERYCMLLMLCIILMSCFHSEMWVGQKWSQCSTKSWLTSTGSQSNHIRAWQGKGRGYFIKTYCNPCAWRSVARVCQRYRIQYTQAETDEQNRFVARSEFLSLFGLCGNVFTWDLRRWKLFGRKTVG